MKRLSLAFALAALLGASAHANLPAGSFGGSSPLLSGPDIMALLLKPAENGASHAILAEYDRLPYIPGPERIEITRWVPRMYVYRVEKLDDLNYAFKPLRVSAGGEIEVDGGYASFGKLTLREAGSLKGATLTRYEKGSVMIAETVSFDGKKISSTWEDYVPGTYFGTKDSTGGDYFNGTVNTTLRADKVAEFDQPDIAGVYDVAEKAAGLFVFTEKTPAVRGRDQIAGRIGVFVDIVNWKPFFTTDELLLVNPDDARDVGFYYERH